MVLVMKIDAVGPGKSFVCSEDSGIIRGQQPESAVISDLLHRSFSASLKSAVPWMDLVSDACSDGLH